MAKARKKTNETAEPTASESMDEVQASYRRIEPELDLLAPAEVQRVTVDVPTAVSRAVASIPLLEGLSPEMKKQLTAPPIEHIARVRDYSFGLLYTHLRYVPRRSETVQADLEEARVLREQMLAAADAHVTYGHIPRDAVATVRDGAGHLDRASDLIALANLFRAVEARIRGATPVTEAQLARATELGTRLIAELGGRELGIGADGAGPRDWRDRRNRAFTVFMRNWEEIRRAVNYVRYHERDAQAYAPVLQPRGSRRSDEEQVDEATEVVTEATES